MNYVRTFYISAAHFNSEAAYQVAWRVAAKAQDVGLDELKMALTDMHGHNFRIEIGVTGHLAGQPWLIDDAALERVVRQWDNQNLSMHDDFMDDHARATTECMACRLLEKLRGDHAERIAFVRVWETNDIYAEAT